MCVHSGECLYVYENLYLYCIFLNTNFYYAGDNCSFWYLCVDSGTDKCKERTLEIYDGEEVIEGRDENRKRF
jgi:hypothetical protein